MTAVIDTSVLLFFLDEQTSAPFDRSTGQRVTYCPQRVQLLIETLERAQETLVLPTPVLSEVLVRAGAAAPGYLGLLEKSKAIRLANFDKRAAVEAAAMLAHLQATGHPMGSGDARAKLKFDIMIAAILKVSGADRIYSDDGDILALGTIFSFGVVGVSSLPVPPDLNQPDLFQPSP